MPIKNASLKQCKHLHQKQNFGQNRDNVPLSRTTHWFKSEVFQKSKKLILQLIRVRCKGENFFLNGN